jgi:hypothetical protein
MLVVVALLIAPSAYHRISEHGLSTGKMCELTGRCAEAALLPFGVALGLDLALACAWTFRSLAAGAAAGVGFTLLALVGWFGMGRLMQRTYGDAERRKAASEQDKQERGPLHARVEQMVTEARVILPGAQALLGFQLVIVLSQSFEKLPDLSKTLHGAALLCVALAVLLLITPAALHRIVWAGEDSETFLRIGGRITVAALLPLALGMAGDIYVVIARIFGSAAYGLTAGGAGLGFLLVCWFGCPCAARRWGGSPEQAEHAGRAA